MEKPGVRSHRALSCFSCNIRDEKSGVLFFGLESEDNRRIDQFADTAGEEMDDRLSKASDAINAKYCRETIFHLSEGGAKPWRMRRDMPTPNYTTRRSRIPVVK